MFKSAKKFLEPSLNQTEWAQRDERAVRPPLYLGRVTSGRAASIEDAKAQFLTNWQNWRIKTELEKRLALEVAEPRSLNPSRKRQMLDSQISKYVAVRRNRGEQMKAIVPASAKRFAVSERTVWVAVGGTDSRISAIQPT